MMVRGNKDFKQQERRRKKGQCSVSVKWLCPERKQFSKFLDLTFLITSLIVEFHCKYEAGRTQKAKTTGRSEKSIFSFPSGVWGKRRMKPEPGNLTFPSISIGINKKKKSRKGIRETEDPGTSGLLPWI